MAFSGVHARQTVDRGSDDVIPLDAGKVDETFLQIADGLIDVLRARRGEPLPGKLVT